VIEAILPPEVVAEEAFGDLPDVMLFPRRKPSSSPAPSAPRPTRMR
jgi:hypothetical protein